MAAYPMAAYRRWMSRRSMPGRASLVFVLTYWRDGHAGALCMASYTVRGASAAAGG